MGVVGFLRKMVYAICEAPRLRELLSCTQNPTVGIVEEVGDGVADGEDSSRRGSGGVDDVHTKAWNCDVGCQRGVTALEL
jgi:hypothetical protein